MKRIKSRIGNNGWREKLQKVYTSFEEFQWYCEMYAIHKQLGFRTVKRCWDANPTMSGSVVAGELKRVK